VIGVSDGGGGAGAQVSAVTSSKILRIMKKIGLAPEIPEDLYCLIKKAVTMRKHLEANRKDRDGKFRLILVESRIHRLARYYKVQRWPRRACACHKEGDLVRLREGEVVGVRSMWGGRLFVWAALVRTQNAAAHLLVLCNRGGNTGCPLCALHFCEWSPCGWCLCISSCCELFAGQQQRGSPKVS